MAYLPKLCLFVYSGVCITGCDATRIVPPNLVLDQSLPASDRSQHENEIQLNFSIKAINDIDINELRTGRGPVVFLVNGFGGCAPCVLEGLTDKLRKESITVYVTDWNDILRLTQAESLNLSSRSFIRDMAFIFENVVRADRPIILIGHSFGGDSAIRVAQQVSRRIELLGVLDGGAAGGIRTKEAVGSNVDYFYNRWTRHSTIYNGISLQIPGIPVNVGILVNSETNGDIPSRAHTSDQREASIARKADGSEIRDECESWEVTCPGYNPIPVSLGGSNGTKQRRLTHGGKHAIYKDAYIQQQLFDLIMGIAKTRTGNAPDSLPWQIAPSKSPVLSNIYTPNPFRPGTPGWEEKIGKLSMMNNLDRPIRVTLYHPDSNMRYSGNLTENKPYGNWTIAAGVNEFVGSGPYGMDWGVQVDDGPVAILGTVALWNYFEGKRIFQATWTGRFSTIPQAGR